MNSNLKSCYCHIFYGIYIYMAVLCIEYDARAEISTERANLIYIMHCQNSIGVSICIYHIAKNVHHERSLNPISKTSQRPKQHQQLVHLICIPKHALISHYSLTLFTQKPSSLKVLYRHRYISYHQLCIYIFLLDHNISASNTQLLPLSFTTCCDLALHISI